MKYGKPKEDIPDGGRQGLSYKARDIKKELEEARRQYGDIE